MGIAGLNSVHILTSCLHKVNFGSTFPSVLEYLKSTFFCNCKFM